MLHIDASFFWTTLSYIQLFLCFVLFFCSTDQLPQLSHRRSSEEERGTEGEAEENGLGWVHWEWREQWVGRLHEWSTCRVWSIWTITIVSITFLLLSYLVWVMSRRRRKPHHVSSVTSVTVLTCTIQKTVPPKRSLPIRLLTARIMATAEENGPTATSARRLVTGQTPVTMTKPFKPLFWKTGKAQNILT